MLVSAQQRPAIRTLEAVENADPVIEDPILEADGTTKKIEPKIPVGKTLLIPIAASDADGDPLSFKVTSSNPKVMVRVRTGRPHLKFDVSYAGTTDQAGSDPQFSGTLDFQLFRDWTPVTAGFIGGFAQSLFYSPKSGSTEQHTIFHRVVKDFMVQGGDPNGQLPDPPSGNALERGPGFTFGNEFDIPLLFSGRGQLAMANAGLTSTYDGTNGSQFFVTTSSPRFLDVKHTIFGQLVRGWELLEKMNNVPVQAQSSGGEVSRPKTDIKITNSSVAPNFSDALLVLSAVGATPTATPATITVQVSDGKGGTAEKQFQVSAVQDEFNTPPIFTKLPENQVIPVGKISSIPVKGVDLEQDYFIYENALLPSYFPRGQSSRGGNPMLVLPDSSNPGPMTLGFWMRQLEMSENNFEFAENEYQQLGQRDRRSIALGVNDANLRTEPIPVTGKPDVSLTAAVASYIDTDPRGQSSNVTIGINWGDGTPTSSGAIGRDTSRPTSTSYRIAGTHKYVRKGVYPVVTTITSSKGLKEVVRSVAVITDGDVSVVGQKHEIKGRTFSGKPLATITDAATGTSAADYEATVDWGDGTVVPGVVKQTGTGQIYVTGNHNYQDPETFSAAIRVHKKGTAAGSDAYAWATLDMTGFQPAEQHLPPFPMAHLVGIMNPVLQDAKNPNTSQDDVYKPIRSTTGAGPTSQTTFTMSLSLLNNGNKKANPSKIRFYLSYDQHLNLESEIYTDNSVNPPVQRTNPKDIPLTIGKKQKEISLIALNPGQGGALTFDQVKGGQDSRLYAPKGENGSGLYLLAAFVYDDPLAKQLPIDQEVALSVAPVYTANPSTVELTETTGPKHSQQFTINFDRRPTAEVKIPLSIIDSSGFAETSEAYFNAALPVPPQDKPNLPPDQNLTSSPGYTVSLTPQQWDAGTKTITVALTGKQDFTKDNDQTVYVKMGPAISDDPRYTGRSSSVVRVVIRDLESLIQVTPVALQTTEAEGSGHTKTFTVQLLQKPLKDVIVPVVIGNEAEGQLSGPLTVVNGKPSLTFNTTDTYPVTKTITVTSVDDNQADGNVEYTIAIGPTTSEDTKFAGLNPPDVTVTNVDNPPAPPAEEPPAENGSGTTTDDTTTP